MSYVKYYYPFFHQIYVGSLKNTSSYYFSRNTQHKMYLICIIKDKIYKYLENLIEGYTSTFWKD